MDTVYYHLQAKRVKVSGGADLVTFLPTAAPVPREGKGAVLDFDRCRRRLETKAAWKELNRAALSPEEPLAEEFPAPQPVPSLREQTAGWLEICASVAVIAVSVAAVLAFLRLV